MKSFKVLRLLVNNPLAAAKYCHCDPAGKPGKQSQRLNAENAGGTGILPVIPIRQAGRLSHPSLLAMPGSRPRSRETEWIRFLAIYSCLWIMLPASLGFCDDTGALIDKALNQSGITGQLELLAPTVLSAVPDDAFPDTKTRDAIGALMKKAAGKDPLLRMVQEALRENFNREMIEQVISFYDSKLGRKVGRLQATALTPALIKTVREGRKTAASMDETRLKLLRRLIKAERVSQYNEQLLQSFVKGLIDGSLGEQGGQDPKSREGLAGIEKGIRFDEARAEEIALVSFAHAFRSLEDKELEQLASYKESQAGTWFGSSVQKGLDRVAHETGKALGEAAYASRRR
ncbi:MAG: hypothetical protein HY913_18065 [Desulfomonile tiedjei]|nr:hypothetical protein [Desulfomonile tiedjei]